MREDAAREYLQGCMTAPFRILRESEKISTHWAAAAVCPPKTGRDHLVRFYEAYGSGRGG